MYILCQKERGRKTHVSWQRKLLDSWRVCCSSWSRDPDRGDLLHAVLEQTYFTTRKPRNREEILIALSRRGFDMSMASYHIYLKQAIRAIDRILWGYTARDCMDIIKQFLPEQ